MDEPTSFRAGDSVSWTLALTDYPAADGWTIRYRLLSQGGIAQDITATAIEFGYSVDLSSSDTANWPAGSATLVCLAENGAQRLTLGAQIVSILPDLSNAGTYDGRSRNEKALEDAEAALSTYVANGQMHVAEYEIAGRRMKFRDVAQIQALISYYRIAVNRDRIAQAALTGASLPGRVYYRG